MKTITKAKRFIERMKGVENLSERQLVELLFRALEIITDYVTTEEKKEAAYARLKAETNYRAKSTKKVVEVIAKPKNVAVLSINTVEVKDTADTIEEVVVNTVDAKEVINTVATETVIETMATDESVNMRATEEEVNMRTILHNVNESKGIVLGSYAINNERVFFAMSKKYSHPVVFGNPSVTNDVLREVQKQMSGFGTGVTKDLKSVSYFGKVRGVDAMVHMVDAKREVFEGYIGDMVFTTTSQYLAKGYTPLVTSAHDFVIKNNGKHNHVTNNACSDVMARDIVNLIASYKETPKFAKAKLDVNYINARNANKPKNVAVLNNAPIIQTTVPTTVVQGANVTQTDIQAAVQAMLQAQAQQNTVAAETVVVNNATATQAGVYVNEMGLADPADILQATYEGCDTDWLEF